MEANIHAIILILILPLSAVFIWVKREACGIKRVGTTQYKDANFIINFGYRFLRITLIFIAVFIVSSFLSFPCSCGTGNNPFSQLWIPALAAAIISTFILSRKIYLLSALLLTVIAIALGIHFHMLVLNTDECKYTGDPEYISNSCDVPAVEVQIWHTWLTGIYKLKIL